MAVGKADKAAMRGMAVRRVFVAVFSGRLGEA
jgi:hypothetical protein